MPFSLIEPALRATSQEGSALVSEANHRIANNLALLSGFVRLHVGSLAKKTEAMSAGEVARLLEEIEARIATIATLHRLLAHNPDERKIELSGYLREVSRSVVSNSIRARLAFETQSTCYMDARNALLIGLIVAELLTNSIKYAHPTGIAARIVISCEKTAEAIVIEVADDGVGLPESFNSQDENALGLRLVRKLAAELNGTVALEDTGLGLRACLTIPHCLSLVTNLPAEKIETATGGAESGDGRRELDAITKIGTHQTGAPDVGSTQTA